MKKLFILMLMTAMLLNVAGCGKAEPEAGDAVIIPVAEDVAQDGEAEDMSDYFLPDIMLPSSDAAELPLAQPDPDNELGMDMSINVNTIDEWLGLEDVAYRDVRMLMDTEPGGIVRGFEVVPYPYLAGESGQEGERLFDLELDQNGNIASVKANYAESEAVINDLFPPDAPIFIMCGDGEYARLTRALLIKLGYDETMLYNLGGYDEYIEGSGENPVEISVNLDGVEYNAFHRISYHYIDFSQLHPVN